jgi:Fe-S-cluster containining protein
MDLFGRQQHLYFINQDLADRVKAWVGEIIGASRTGTTVLELASQVTALADQLISHFEAENSLPHAIACRAGCTPCCYNQVELTPPEALLIGHFVAQNFSAAAQGALKQRVTAACHRKAGKSKKKIARMRHKLPCPLLMEGTCSVYPVRPLVCRAMHSFDAGTCVQELKGGKLGPGAYYAHRYEFVWSISSGIQNGCRELGCQTGILDLDNALQDGLAHDDLLERWTSGFQVFSL